MTISNHFNGNGTELRLAGGLVKLDLLPHSQSLQAATKGQRAIVVMDATENLKPSSARVRNLLRNSKTQSAVIWALPPRS